MAGSLSHGQTTRSHRVQRDAVVPVRTREYSRVLPASGLYQSQRGPLVILAITDLCCNQALDTLDIGLIRVVEVIIWWDWYRWDDGLGLGRILAWLLGLFRGILLFGSDNWLVDSEDCLLQPFFHWILIVLSIQSEETRRFLVLRCKRCLLMLLIVKDRENLDLPDWIKVIWSLVKLWWELDKEDFVNSWLGSSQVFIGILIPHKKVSLEIILYRGLQDFCKFLMIVRILIWTIEGSVRYRTGI